MINIIMVNVTRDTRQPAAFGFQILYITLETTRTGKEPTITYTGTIKKERE